MKPPPVQVSRFSLYGEAIGAIAPEFLHVESISSRSSLHEWTIAPHTHPGIFQLLLLEQGSGMLASDGREQTLQPTSLVMIPSGCAHAFRFAPDAEGLVLSIAADILNDPRIAALRGKDGESRARRALLERGEAAAERLVWLLADLARELARDQAGDQAGSRSGPMANRMAAQLGLLLASVEEVLAHDMPDDMADAHPARHTPSRREDLVQRFRRMVELHFRDGWPVSAYAAGLGATVPTLNRSCRDLLRKSPGEVVLDRLLLEAMRALTYSAASVSQIADSLGFADPAYFARFFKARAGMTASRFRRERAWLGGA